MKNTRCLVPATGFYEWKRDTLGKHPYYFYLKEQKYYSFAGLYTETVHPQTQKPLKSFALITTNANRLMSSIHDRLPVILREEDEAKWIDHDETDIPTLARLLTPYSDTEMGMYAVSPKINSFMFQSKPEKVNGNEERSLFTTDEPFV